MLFLLMLVPAAAGLLAFIVPLNRRRPWLLPVGSVAHLALVLWALQQPSGLSEGDWLVLDPLGKVFLGFFSGFYCLCLTYMASYLTQQPERSNRILCGCSLLSLAMMTLVVLSHHLGLMWVGMEATTLI